MNLDDIVNHEEIKTSTEVVTKIDESIIGRVASNQKTPWVPGKIARDKPIGELQATHVLYIIKNLLGDNCKNVLEIGTLWGGTLLTMMQSEYESVFVSIDMFEGFYPNLIGKGNTDGKFGINTKEIVTENILNNNPWSHEFELIKGSSHDKKIINYIENNYSNIDLLFIDGDHTKKGVLQDWNDYSSLVTKGGLVVFDDHWDDKRLEDSNYAYTPRKNFQRYGWKTVDEVTGEKWMDVVGAVEDITNHKDFYDNWKEVGLYGNKYILERI